MAAASSGESGGLGRRIPLYMDPTNQFGELTFLSLTGKDEKPLPKNPFLIGSSVEKVACGPIEGASTEAQGTRYTLKVRNASQVAKLLNMSALNDGTEVVVKAHPSLNVSRCVISCFEMIDMEEEDIVRGLSSQKVIRAQRITRFANGERIKTPAVILTFGKCTYPPHVKIGLLRIATRPYYPNPLLCYNCLRYGHPRVRCPGPRRCLNCSEEHQVLEGIECSKTAYCINCNQNHRPNDRQCPMYQNEKKIISVKIDQNLSYPEARKRVETTLKSYAAAAAQPNTDKQKFDELEEKIKEKDAQIVQLMETMKKKNEYIEKLVAHFKQTQSSERQAPQSSGKTIAIGTAMQLRNRSPVISEVRSSEITKKSKRKEKSSNTSPGRQSPPLKKQPTENEKTTHLNQEPIDIDEETDTADSSSSQHIHRR